MLPISIGGGGKVALSAQVSISLWRMTRGDGHVYGDSEIGVELSALAAFLSSWFKALEKQWGSHGFQAHAMVSSGKYNIVNL
jgi:hypothetical protein